MNDALEMYKDQKQVYHINGFIFETGNELPNTFFHQVPHSWGWATWSDRWKQLNTNVFELYYRIKPNSKHFNLNNRYNFFLQLKANTTKTLNTWAILWYATIYLNKGLCLTPGKSLVSNIGFGKNATHTKYSFKELLLADINNEKVILKKK